MTEGSSADHSLSTMTAFGCELVLVDRVFRGEDDPRRAVGDLRAVARRDLAPRPLESGLELGEVVGGAVGPHAVVVIEHGAVAREGGFDLAGEGAVLLRGRQPLLALGGIFVGLPPRNVKQVGDQLGGLAHIEFGDRVGEAALEPDHRREERRAEAEQCREFRADAAGGKEPRVPVDRAAAEDERRMAERFRAARQYQDRTRLSRM